MVIGRECTNISEAEALDYVAGYTCAFDTTMKEEKETFSFCKSIDTFATYGPCILTSDEVADPASLGYRFWVNDELRGERSFADLTGSPAQLIAFATSVMTLHPGDILMMGAADVGPVVPGDVMSIEIPGSAGSTSTSRCPRTHAERCPAPPPHRSGLRAGGTLRTARPSTAARRSPWRRRRCLPAKGQADAMPEAASARYWGHGAATGFDNAKGAATRTAG